MKLIFVRHGHPNYALNILTEEGKKQAEAAAERLASEGIDEIYSSALGRAIETAQYTAHHMGKGEITQLPFMNEIAWGQADHPYASGHPWDVADALAQEGVDLLHPDACVAGGFASNIVFEYNDRVCQGFDKWLSTLGYEREGQYYRCVEENDKTIALFSHGGSSSCAMAHIMNLPVPYFFHTFVVDFTAISVFLFSGKQGEIVAPKCLLMNDARHIDGHGDIRYGY